MTDIITYVDGKNAYELKGDVLVANGTPYELGTVESVRLSKLGAQSFCKLTFPQKKKVTIARNSQGSNTAFNLMVDTDGSLDFIDFISDLHEVLARVAPNAKYVAGYVLFFFLGLISLVGTVICMIVLLTKSRMGSTHTINGLIITVLTAIFGIKFVTKGRPQSYRPDALPMSKVS